MARVSAQFEGNKVVVTLILNVTGARDTRCAAECNPSLKIIAHTQYLLTRVCAAYLPRTIGNNGGVCAKGIDTTQH